MYNDSPGREKCYDCASATTPGADNCGGMCGVGKFKNSVSGVCELCQSGQYGDTAGADSCKLCPSGWFVTETNSFSCLPCNRGLYNPVEGSIDVAACLKCSKGRFSSTSGLVSQDKCQWCKPGTFNENEGS